MKTEELTLNQENRKEAIDKTAAEITSIINSGEANPLLILGNIKSWEKVFEKVKEAVIRAAISEAEKYPEKEVSIYGIKFEKTEAGVSYDYKSCGHTKYNEICNQIEELTVKKKELEKTLITIKSPTTIVDNDSGEIMTITPPVKRSTETIKVTLK